VTSGPLTDEKIRAIQASRAAAMPIKQICEVHAVSEATVKKLVADIQPQYTSLSPEIVKTARREYAEDKTVTVIQLAERHGGVDPLKLAQALRGETYGRIRNPRPLFALRHEPELLAIKRQRAAPTSRTVT